MGVRSSFYSYTLIFAISYGQEGEKENAAICKSIAWCSCGQGGVNYMSKNIWT